MESATYQELSVTKRMRVGGQIESSQKPTLLVSGTLDVQSEIAFHGRLTAMGQVDIGTDDKRADLHVKGDGDLDGDLQVAENVGIGTKPDSKYQLMVSGDTYLGGDLTVTGNIDTAAKVKEGGNDLVPQGVIVMWSGDTIPSGWALCNGDTYPTSSGESVTTPDLSGRFIVGIGQASGPGAGTTNYSMGSRGGEETHALDITEMPSHKHEYPEWVGQFRGAHGGAGKSYQNCQASSEVNRETSIIGDGNAHENRPPYYALAYIMKL